MPNIIRYQVRVYGSPDGREHKRTQIYLFTDEPITDPNRIAGIINFYDKAPFPADSQIGEGRSSKIYMNLPTAMLASVVDLLRNEKPIVLGFYVGGAILDTAQEFIGENE